VFVNDRVLCVQLPPPSANATALPPEDETRTNRQAVEAHTSACGAGCHTSFINPAGFAFENFDVVGKYRSTDRGKPIDSTGTYPFTEPSGPTDLAAKATSWGSVQTTHTGAIDFSRQVATSSQANTCFASQWFKYVKARDIADVEVPLVNYYGAMSRAGALPVRDLVLDLVSSNDFFSRIDEATP
jgi:hypothetical protein